MFIVVQVIPAVVSYYAYSIRVARWWLRVVPNLQLLIDNGFRYVCITNIYLFVQKGLLGQSNIIDTSPYLRKYF